MNLGHGTLDVTSALVSLESCAHVGTNLNSKVFVFLNKGDTFKGTFVNNSIPRKSQVDDT